MNEPRKDTKDTIGKLLAFAMFILALLAYLAPFGPVGPSPFAPDNSESTLVASTLQAEPASSNTSTIPAEPSVTSTTEPATSSAATVPASATSQDMARVLADPTSNSTATTTRPGDTTTTKATVTRNKPAEPDKPTATLVMEDIVATPTLLPATVTTITTPTPITATAKPLEVTLPVGLTGVAHINQPWEHDGVSLTARAIEVLAKSDYGNHAARIWFRLVNKTGQRLLVDIDWTHIHLEDSLGNTYIDWDPGEQTSVWVETGENFDFDRYYAVTPRNHSRVPDDATFVQVVAREFSRVVNARWQYDINSQLQPDAARVTGTTESIGGAWGQDGLSLRLTGLIVSAESDYGDAAARAWFEVTNHTSQELLVEIDYGQIALFDSYGRRFGDWDGGGVYAASIEANDTLTFDRYYSDRSRMRSRITRGSSYVLVTAEDVGRIARATWRVPLDVRLSTGETPPQTAPLRINQSWEQSGVSLTARTIQVSAESDYGDHAARVWFRLVNKTGQRLLLPIDWSAIYLEDGHGTRYGDWEGGLMSVWVEAGANFDFDRYYSVTPRNRSRVPSNAGFVQVVVDRLSTITAARWQYDINPQLQPIAEPATNATKAIGEAWEQDGLTLRLADLQVSAESDYGDHAARAWFELTNNLNSTVIAEVDFGNFAVFDSFGRRFGDWEGGGIHAVTIEGGDTITFDRYYSEMSRQRSRITRGAKFVLLTFDNVAGMVTGMWRLDVVR